MRPLSCTLFEVLLGGSLASGLIRSFYHHSDAHLMHSRFARVLLSALFSVVLLGVAVSPAHGQFGLTGGLNFESADDINTSSGEATLNNATAYHLGIVYEAGSSPLSFRPGVLYRKVGEYEFPDGRTDVARFEVPFDIKLTLPIPVLSPYLLGGPMVVFPRVEDEFGDNFEDVAYSLNVGVGAKLSLGSGSSLQPELRYEYGLNEYTTDDFLSGSEDGPRFQGVALRLNVIF